MSNEEALKLLSNYVIDTRLGLKIMADTSDFMNTCKEALEKQIPKKPLIRYENMGFGVSPNENIKIYCCPCCKEDTDGATYFCQYCGQRIDWSDENDRAD